MHLLFDKAVCFLMRSRVFIGARDKQEEQLLEKKQNVCVCVGVCGC